MKTAALQEPGRFEIVEMDQPMTGQGEVLIRIHACGICTSELDMWSGKAQGMEYPKYLGHEAAGTVESVGPGVTKVRPGDRVAVWAENFGYGEYLVASEDYLYLLKEDTPFDLALGEPIACAVNGVRKLDPQLNDSICLVGCGFMGLIMLQVFQRRGVGMIVAVDTRDSVLELAGKLGATHTLNPMQTDVSNEIKELTDGKGVDIGVEASGIQQTLDLTSSLVRMEGKLEVFGYHQGGLRSVDWAYWNWMAFQIVNGHSRSAQIYVEGMKIGLEMLERNALNMKDLVTHRFALNDINKAFEMAVQKPDGFIKGVITV